MKTNIKYYENFINNNYYLWISILRWYDNYLWIRVIIKITFWTLAFKLENLNYCNFFTVTWQKGVRELVYDARHRIIAYGTLQTLEIPSVLIMDHGEYFVRAANVFGIIESSCLVKVNKKGRKMAER